MSGRKNILITLGFGLFVGLTASGGCVLLASRYYSRLLFDLLNALCEEAAAREPELRNVIAAVLKEYTSGNAPARAKEDFLSVLGYRISDFSGAAYGWITVFAAFFLWRDHCSSCLLFCGKTSWKPGGSRPWQIIWSRSTGVKQSSFPPPGRMIFLSWKMKYTRP